MAIANLIRMLKPFHELFFKSTALRGLSKVLLRVFLPTHVNMGEAIVCTNPEDPVVSLALAMKLYEVEETSYFRQNFNAGMTFVDVGANIGLFTALAIRQGASQILAIEPHSESFEFLKKTINKNNPLMSVSAEKVAVGSKSGEGKLYLNPFNKGDNRICFSKELVEGESIVIRTLDSICAKHGINSIDFLKIDVQGTELGILEGAVGVLGNSRRCIIMTEVWPSGMEKSGYSSKIFSDFLTSLGFKVEKVFGRTDQKIPALSKGFADYTNIVAIKQ
jgi:FkbM family methyltransferase